MKIKYLRSVRIAGLTLLLVLAWSLYGSVDTTKANPVNSMPLSAAAACPALQSGPEPMTAEEIFAQVSPSIAFVETPRGQGGGVLIEEGYVVTNAHVVWPYQQVRVVFPDGSEYPNAPVHNWDLLGDLAVIGPLQTTIEPAKLGDGETLGIGSDVYLIGYPGEVDEFPEPTLTRGLISRLREWAAIDMTYFQTDAIIAGGQSGGVLVSETGEIIGISGLYITESRFGLVASAADVLPRLERLIAGDDVAGLGDRQVPLEAEQLEYDLRLENDWHCRMYVLHPPPDTAVELAVEGQQDGALGLIDAAGNVIFFEDNGVSGSETGSATTTSEAPYFVVLWQIAEDPGDFQVSSSYPLVPYEDGDDGSRLTVGQTRVGNIDHPFDYDYFALDLAEGDTIDVSVESILIDPVLTIDFKGATEAEAMEDDDSGGGPFGLNAKLTFRAPHKGRFLVVVHSAGRDDIGGYFLTVTEAPSGAEVAAPQPSVTSISSRYGPMSRYESAQHPFSIQHPAGWTEEPVEEGYTALFSHEQGGALVIAEEDLVKQGFGETTLAEYIDLITFSVESNNPTFQLVSREEMVTIQGLPVEVLEFTTDGGFFRASRFIYMHENRVAFNATYHAPRARHAELEPVIDYTFDSFRVWLPGQEDQAAVFIYDQGVEHLAEGEMELAIKAFSQAIELAPTLAEAYIERASAYGLTGRFADALADAHVAVELSPNDPDVYHTRAYVHWLSADYPAALADIDQLLQLDPQNDDGFNLRALFLASQGDYEAALVDVNQALDLRPSNNTNLLDTRGYIYLKAEQYEQARADYEEILSQGIEHAYALLGRGLTYTALDEPERALELLDQGLEKSSDVQFPDPQLADLIERAEQAHSNLRIPILAQSNECPPACSQANLSGVDLPRADLSSTDLSQANLSETNLVKADLRQADLSSANLSEANLIGANLDGVELSEVVLREAVYDETTTWPPNFDPVQAGALARDEALKKYLRRGQVNYEAGELEEAIRSFDQALELDPGDVQAHLHRGIAHLDTGNPEQAQLDFNQVLRLDPDLAEAYVMRGKTYRALDDLERAVVAYERAIELDPNDSRAHQERALIYYGLGDYEQAVLDFNRALELDPGITEAYLKRGNAFGVLYGPDEAIADFNQAIELDADNSVAYNYRGIAYERKGDYEQAIIDYDQAIELDPSFAMAYGNRAYSYYQLDNFEQSVADNSKAIELNPDFPFSYRGRGKAYYQLGEYEQAVTDFTKAIELKSDFADAYHQRGRTYYRLGDYDQAIADYSEAIVLDPGRTHTYVNRAWVYYKLGNYDQALIDYNKAIDLDPDNPHFTAPYTGRGWIYYVLGDYELALADFDRSLELNPSAYAFVRRAVTHDAAGNSAQAVQDFEQAILTYEGEPVEAHNELAWTLAYHLDTHFDVALVHAQRAVELESRADNHDTLALVHYKLEQYDQALEHYDIAIALDPEQAESYKGRGDVYLALDDQEAALADYQSYLALARPGPERTEVEELTKSLQQP
jgi:tetratricopeptide (TPR) repeat protein/S1-C subfamily serine protease